MRNSEDNLCDTPVIFASEANKIYIDSADFDLSLATVGMACLGVMV